MKRLLFLFAILMIAITATFAQAPQKMSYQAVVRNANNALVTDQAVSVQVSIWSVPHRAQRFMWKPIR